MTPGDRAKDADKDEKVKAARGRITRALNEPVFTQAAKLAAFQDFAEVSMAEPANESWLSVSTAPAASQTYNAGALLLNNTKG